MRIIDQVSHETAEKSGNVSQMGVAKFHPYIQACKNSIGGGSGSRSVAADCDIQS